LLATHGKDVDDLVRAAYQSAFNRDPDDGERTDARSFLADKKVNGSQANPLSTAAVVDFCHALLNAAELLYVE
jgi:hypothetical protein